MSKWVKGPYRVHIVAHSIDDSGVKENHHYHYTAPSMSYDIYRALVAAGMELSQMHPNYNIDWVSARRLKFRQCNMGFTHSDYEWK